MVTAGALERLFEEWAERVVAMVLDTARGGEQEAADRAAKAAGVAREVAGTCARDAAARVVSTVVAAVIVQRARKSAVATVAARVASARIVEGYPVNVFHLCVSE